MPALTPREAAYQALLNAYQEKSFISDTLEQWRREANPAPRDANLAQEIASGTARMAIALDAIAKQLTAKQKLQLKRKERILLQMAIYQHIYMDRIPPHAIVNEAVSLAKKHCHSRFIPFLNAVLRSLSKQAPELPQGDTAPEISLRYAYPLFFVKELINDYGVDTAKDIMEAENQPPKIMVKTRSKTLLEGLEPIEEGIALVKETSLLPQLTTSSDYYVQNGTPIKLIKALAAQTKPPERILDLCASPGGKLLAAHDLFPKATLYANDISENKVARLRENCEKYGLKAILTISMGEEYTSEDLFDLIILDVPCSNSGVLHKRPEARWRLSEEALNALEKIQNKLLKHAATLLSPTGEIWYITCSILKQENEELTKQFCKENGFTKPYEKTVLPDATTGFDGGYCCRLSFSG